MSRLIWDQVGDRLFTTGVDRGVLYVGSNPGVPWDGLVSINESSIGGEVVPSYLDGVKLRDRMGKSEYAATIEAITYPSQFEECDGTASLGNGLFATEQKRKRFNLSYRTLVGNDVSLIDHGYKIHLVYNVLAKPSSVENQSIGSTYDPVTFAWDISATPPRFAGVQPTAHFVIDSNETPEGLLDTIEDILYGSLSSTPRLPSLRELLFLFENYEASVFDAGFVGDPYYSVIDADYISEPQTSTIDGGSP